MLRGREPLVAKRLLAVGVLIVAVVVVRAKGRERAFAVVVGPVWTLVYLAALRFSMIATDVAVVGVWTKKRRRWGCVALVLCVVSSWSLCRRHDGLGIDHLEVHFLGVVVFEIVIVVWQEWRRSLLYTTEPFVPMVRPGFLCLIANSGYLILG